MTVLKSLRITKPKRYFDGKGWERKLIGTTSEGKDIIIDTEVSYRGDYSNDASLEKLADEIRKGENISYSYDPNSGNKSSKSVSDKVLYQVVNPDNGVIYKVFNSLEDAQEYGEDQLKGNYQVQELKLREFVERNLFMESYDDEYYDDDDSNVGSHNIDWTLDIPAEGHDELVKALFQAGYTEEDAYDNDQGKKSYEFDASIEYSVEEEDGDEYIDSIDSVEISDVNNNKIELVKFLNEDDIESIKKELTDHVDLKSYDPTEEWRRDYYNSVL